MQESYILLNEMGSQGGVCTDKWDDLTYILKDHTGCL